MSQNVEPLRMRSVFVTVLSALLVVGGFLYANNIYYDLDTQKTMIETPGGFTVSLGAITISGDSIILNPSGAVNITATSSSIWKTIGADLTIETDTSGALAITSAGSLTETFAVASGYQLKRGADVMFAIDTNGAISLTATGTDQDITLVPSGTGQVKFYSASYYMNSGGDLVIGGKFTFENSEYISNETDGYLLFQGSGGTPQDLVFDLDGSYPIIYSSSTATVGMTIT